MTAKAKYSDKRWRKLRARFLQANPTCMDTSGCTEPSADVHHLDGLGLNGPRGYDWTNLQALCHSHHSQITAREHGWGTRPKRVRPVQRHPGLTA